MLRFVLRRVGLMGFTMFLVSIGIFASTELLPSDAVDVFLGRGATEENSALLRAELGLDRSAPVRYFEWMAAGDLQIEVAIPFEGVHSQVEMGIDK